MYRPSGITLKKMTPNKTYLYGLNRFISGLIVQGDVYAGQVSLDNFGVYFTKDTNLLVMMILRKLCGLEWPLNPLLILLGPGYKLGEDNKRRQN